MKKYISIFLITICILTTSVPLGFCAMKSSSSSSSSSIKSSTPSSTSSSTKAYTPSAPSTTAPTTKAYVPPTATSSGSTTKAYVPPATVAPTPAPQQSYADKGRDYYNSGISNTTAMFGGMLLGNLLSNNNGGQRNYDPGYSGGVSNGYSQAPTIYSLLKAFLLMTIFVGIGLFVYRRYYKKQ